MTRKTAVLPTSARATKAKPRAVKMAVPTSRTSPVPTKKASPHAKAAPGLKSPKKGPAAAAKKTVSTHPKAPVARKAAAPDPTPATAPATAPAAAPSHDGLDIVVIETQGKVRKAKLVRNSFTMPEAEYAILGEVKKACIKADYVVKKSELLRVGVALVGSMNIVLLKDRLAALPPLKPGRPKKT